METLRFRYLFLPLLLLCLVLPCSLVSQPHIQTASQYFGVMDNPDNHGPEIKMFLNSVGLPEGNPYCASFVSYCLSQHPVIYPQVRSALASNFILDDSVDAKDVMMGRKTVPAGSIIIWRKGNTMFGHAGFVLLDWQGARGLTIEGNTTLYKYEGIWVQKRIIYPANYFRITNFTLVKYE